ncbi:SgcJ/EcaC family oxidoreductase [Rhodocytophaga rosea]|uniref:SgcJ/EcaC family oxidoreductase n=1 Tax=Rhodocytophaga rosea TaxID=2704465 RepID=A0A6C0GGK2_9BACT|nr:SgcJ/EcaC family oxidoreductase [Rhodocytophaga rosea]QHT66913.1 SgcJ/EcaC family oxidoreductase [Rhodocytophaga rosea]
MRTPFILLIILVLTIVSVRAQTQANASDTKAIEALASGWQAAWNNRDAAALSSLLAEEVDFVTVIGPKGWLKGRKEFLEAHAWMLKNIFTESVWTNKETHIKFIRPDLAIARVLWETTGDRVRHRKYGELREGIFTWVVEKKQGNWLIISSQNTENMPVLPGQ